MAGTRGFFRGFKGTVAPLRAELDVVAAYDRDHNRVTLTVSNRGAHRASVHMTSRYTRQAVTVILGPGERKSREWSLEHYFGWYDVVLTAEEDRAFEYRFAGHVETGADSISDPLMGGLI